MKSGKLRHVINVQRAVVTTNETGTPITNWITGFPLRAELLDRSATETNTDGGAEDRETMTFRTRFVAGVSNANRLQFRGADFNIKRVRVIGNDQGLEIECLQIGGVE
ncbi:phage head closure protein [Fuscibacter oryzae]|uniref:Phage head closure protein n=1 Tax=Fuscibacter oryzae TaxID=2803939 RepID=A0A8J7STP8_9RHOB|nr:phage head closure protein [Fuscibacter oryzae]MBL4928790.1 phage head closure protein [Fuscibacter oryzae]